MKQGTLYVGIVIVALAGYFVYQSWFNPTRAVKRRLGEIASVLSVPEHESDFDRVVRLSKLRGYLANDIRLRAGPIDFSTRDTIVGALTAIRAARGALDIQCVDVQVSMESETTAHSGLMLEVNTHDERTGELLSDRYETIVDLQKRDGEWIVIKADIRTSRSRR